jgi:hypothetical protein
MFVRAWLIAMSTWLGSYVALVIHLLRRGRSFTPGTGTAAAQAGGAR